MTQNFMNKQDIYKCLKDELFLAKKLYIYSCYNR